MIDLAAGQTVALVGPNGAGKSTVLRTLAASLEPPVGVVHQDLLLFPHLSAVDNVAYGLRRQGLRRAEARARAMAWLERLEVAHRAHARPDALSGGEAQRVALARALAPRPRVLLLDEPLSALDASARVAARRLLREHLAAFEGERLLVTHDPVDAAALADRIVVLEDRQVVQEGTLDELRARPRSRFVADLVGVNLWRGVGGPTGVTLADGTVLAAPDVPLGDVLVVVHPRAVALHASPPGGSPRNVLRGTVRHVHRDGERVRVEVDGPVPVVAEVTAAAVADLVLAAGTEVWAAVKATELSVEPA
ncbi:MAG TPA: ABC transporter ATP-binding protein [Acidimicrobiales bacterium]|jgi:molybdate transport system ATP-binding protein